MGWTGTTIELKSKKIKREILEEVGRDDTVIFCESKENYLIFEIDRPKETNLWDDNKCYVLRVQVEEAIKLMRKILRKERITYNDIFYYMDSDLDSMKLIRTSYRR